MTHSLGSLRTFIIRARFLYLVICLAALFVLTPVLEAAQRSEVPLRLVLTLVILSGIYAVAGRRRDLVVATILAAPAIATDWFVPISDSSPASAVSSATTIVFVAYLASRIIIEVFRDEHVRADTIAGAVCVYLLVGWLFAHLYDLANHFWPDTLSGVPEVGDGLHRSTVLYYSFVTLTTLGYGDVLPTGGATRTLAYLEAVIGQLYPAILIARFVGLHVSQSLEARRR